MRRWLWLGSRWGHKRCSPHSLPSNCRLLSPTVYRFTHLPPTSRKYGTVLTPDMPATQGPPKRSSEMMVSGESHVCPSSVFCFLFSSTSSYHRPACLRNVLCSSPLLSSVIICNSSGPCSPLFVRRGGTS